MQYTAKTITQHEIEQAFREYKAEVKELVMQPLYEQVIRVKADLTAAMQLIDEEDAAFKSEASGVMGVFDIVGRIFGDVLPTTKHETETVFVTEETLRQLKRNKLPQGVSAEAVEKAKRVIIKRLKQDESSL